jgi:cell wall-associated NlpC family hydrolase
MSLKRKRMTSVFALVMTAVLSAQTTFAYSNVTLKAGMRSDDVYTLQKDLNELGFMTVKPTGYYGSITKTAVIKMQKQYGLLIDGIAGKQTLGKLDSLMGRTAGEAEAPEAEAATAAAVSEAEDSAAQAKDVKAEQIAEQSQKSSRASSGAADGIIDYAKRFIGVKYVWGGSTSRGFDCSGFVKYVFDHFDISLSRNSTSQAKNGTYIKKSDLMPGDIVFFDTDGGKNRINHVGIYIGAGKMIHSSSSHKGVVISDISSGFYAKTYMTARRVL